MPKPINKVRLVENALNSTPVPSPKIAPRLICLTAAGFNVRPSFVNGVFASRECEYGVLLNDAASDDEDGVYGEVSRRVSGRGWSNGSDTDSPNAINTGRLRIERDDDERSGRASKSAGRTVRCRSMVGSHWRDVWDW